ncbi:unnamed protein product [Amoebophrya sp. A25]|nr:unnamed protein product [Amoebophrya sp. A25]|eukprot:GSA25T00006621001.1
MLEVEELRDESAEVRRENARVREEGELADARLKSTVSAHEEERETFEAEKEQLEAKITALEAEKKILSENQKTEEETNLLLEISRQRALRKENKSLQTNSPPRLKSASTSPREASPKLDSLRTKASSKVVEPKSKASSPRSKDTMTVSSKDSKAGSKDSKTGSKDISTSTTRTIMLSSSKLEKKDTNYTKNINDNKSTGSGSPTSTVPPDQQMQLTVAQQNDIELKWHAELALLEQDFRLKQQETDRAHENQLSQLRHLSEEQNSQLVTLHRELDAEQGAREKSTKLLAEAEDRLKVAQDKVEELTLQLEREKEERLAAAQRDSEAHERETTAWREARAVLQGEALAWKARCHALNSENSAQASENKSHKEETTLLRAQVAEKSQLLVRKEKLLGETIKELEKLSTKVANLELGLASSSTPAGIAKGTTGGTAGTITGNNRRRPSSSSSISPLPSQRSPAARTPLSSRASMAPGVATSIRGRILADASNTASGADLVHQTDELPESCPPAAPVASPAESLKKKASVTQIQNNKQLLFPSTKQDQQSDELERQAHRIEVEQLFAQKKLLQDNNAVLSSKFADLLRKADEMEAHNKALTLQLAQSEADNHSLAQDYSLLHEVVGGGRAENRRPAS